jgi:xylulokinase
MGIVKQGLVSATIGTSGVVFAHAESVVPNPEGLLQSFCHAVPGKWCVFGCMLSAGGSLDWARDVLYKGERRKDLYALIESEAKGSVAGSRGLIFLPYLEGERCPHPDPNARGCWIGLTRLHTRGDMARAVMEGITFGMADQIKMMRDLGVTINQVRCGGGGARSSFWLQLQADTYDARTVTVDTVDASAYGVAILAGVGAGVWKTVEQACKECVNIETTHRPTRRAVDFYRDFHATYQELYPTLQHSFRKLADGLKQSA